VAPEQGFRWVGPRPHRGRMSNGNRLHETGGLIRWGPARRI